MSVTFVATEANHESPAHRRDLGELNVVNGNAAVLLALLGFPAEDLFGEATLPEMRRALMLARARLDRDPTAYTRPAATVVGPPRSNADGTLTARPIRAYVGGLDAGRLTFYLDTLQELVLAAAAAGATHIAWG